jgi:hypothetical protein
VKTAPSIQCDIAFHYDVSAVITLPRYVTVCHGGGLSYRDVLINVFSDIVTDGPIRDIIELNHTAVLSPGSE